MDVGTIIGIGSAVLVLAMAVAGIAIAYAVITARRSRLAQSRANEAERQKLEVVNFFSDFSHSFRDYEDPITTMNAMAKYIADLVGADSVCIYESRYNFMLATGVFGEYPLLKRAFAHLAAGAPEKRLALLRRDKVRLGEGFVGEVAASRDGVLVPAAISDDRFKAYADYAKIGSVMAVPMVRDQRLYGMVVATGAKRKKEFDAEALESLKFIAAQVIMVQSLLGVYADRSRQQRLNQELEFARQLQASMLPQSLPTMELFEVQAYTGSSKEVNGDFYDFVEIDEDRLLVVLGDACGKGVPACMLTSMTRSFIRSAIDHFDNMEEFLREINRNLYRDTDEERYVTLGCCLLNRSTGIVEYARAGHTDLLVHLNNHLRTFYPAGAGVGVLPNEFATFDTICFELRRGATLMMFSDGLSEALNEDNEEFGVERLKEVFANSCQRHDSLEITVNKTLEAVRRFAVEQEDDQTMILIRRR